ncbi:MAG: hypothetical protein RLZ26_1843 [Pseudomonadota bacterium]|jgi:LysR family pca operon transcriptional activator
MDRRIKFRHLEVFSAIARAITLKQAAEQLNLTQPAVSKTLKDLETIIGTLLVDRSRAGIRLTPAGESFLIYAEQSTAAIRHGLRSLQGAGAASGRLRVGALPSVASSILPAAAKVFAEAYPDTLLEVHEGRHLDLTASLQNGWLDLVVGRLGRPESMTGLTFRQLYSEEVVVAARPESAALLAHSFSDLESFRVIYPPKESAIRPLVARLLISQGTPLFSNRIETTSSTVGRALTLSDPNTVWFISRGVVAADLATGQLGQLSLDTTATTGAVGIMSRADEVASTAQRAFARLLGAQAKQPK